MPPFTFQTLAREALISAVINSAFSFLFAFLLFRQLVTVPAAEIVKDGLVQTAFVVFFAAAIPSLITRAKHKLAVKVWPILLVSLLAAIMLALIMQSVHGLVFNAGSIESLGFTQFVGFKLIYAFVVSIVVTPLALFTLDKVASKNQAHQSQCA
ncbi:hypothetical protein [Halioxenophilus aromaticivorans]|uniref:DUF2798 domain-containing protein n=1 Tax=Halioxenophilus aromaticivorans TaxID=1306992 RepID=A0AAV3U2J7_9ALTE